MEAIMDATFRPPRDHRWRVPSWMQHAAVRALSPYARWRGPRGTNVVGILTYHRVCLVRPGRGRPTFNVTPQQLRRQLQGLVRRGWQAWPLSRILQHGRDGIPVPRRTFVVTFDDGYANNVSHALPILVALGIPATFFLATAYLDSTAAFPFDDWPLAGRDDSPRDQWVPLTRSQCRDAQSTGLIELGCHTHTHQVFRNRPNAFHADVRKSVAVLQRDFGTEQPAFSFPYGIADDDLVDAARRCGATCGLTTAPQLVDCAGDPFQWGRFHVSQADTAASLAVKLDGWFDALRGLARRIRTTRPAAPPVEVGA
jgi:peptidoglycan/xylan/chitin deacetylase (PgdA/CDA1 family)